MNRINEKLLNWASILEPGTRTKAERASQMPFIYPHLALMPDAQAGKGATVGSVIPTLGAIMPAAVGTDIGCGMITVKTQYQARDLLGAGKTLAGLRTSIERAIPVWAAAYNREITETAAVRISVLEKQARDAGFDPGEYARDWRLQLGSLGSGNHFIDVSVDEDDSVWLFLHSGSRGVGTRIAEHHIAVAQQLTERFVIDLPDPDLAYLVEGTEEFATYIKQMQWAQRFAMANREEMMDRLITCFEFWISNTKGEPATVDQLERINCPHNFTKKERHLGKYVWLSRKGAIDAHDGVMGLIPGSRGTTSYVVQGKGNRAALCSSPHRAGRHYSGGSAARNAFTPHQKHAPAKGIEYRDADSFISEQAATYKNIDLVMADAADLVEVKHTLRPVLKVKGD